MDEHISQLCIDAAYHSENPDDWFNVGLMFTYGLGVETHIRTAIHWFAKAAEQGHVEGMNNLATLLVRVEEYEEAVEWFQRAADNGDEMAGRNLARCHALMRKQAEEAQAD